MSGLPSTANRSRAITRSCLRMKAAPSPEKTRHTRPRFERQETKAPAFPNAGAFFLCHKRETFEKFIYPDIIGKRYLAILRPTAGRFYKGGCRHADWNRGIDRTGPARAHGRGDRPRFPGNLHALRRGLLRHGNGQRKGRFLWRQKKRIPRNGRAASSFSAASRRSWPWRQSAPWIFRRM